MKKLFILLVCICFVMPDIAAQKKVKTKEWTETIEGDDKEGHYVQTTTYERGYFVASGAWRNWTMNAAIGTQMYQGEFDRRAKFSEWWVFPVVDLYFNKWISPKFGLGLGFTYSPFKGLYNREMTVASFKTDEYYCTYSKMDLYRQKGHTFNPYVIALMDIDNLIFGYDPVRIYNLAFYAGGGLIFGNDPIQARCGATFNLGFYNIFRVGKRFDITLNLRGSLVSDSFDGESRHVDQQTVEYIQRNIPFDVTLGATAGIIYHFKVDNKQKEWRNVGRVTKTYPGFAAAKNEIKYLKDELQKRNEENNALIQEKNEIQDKVDQIERKANALKSKRLAVANREKSKKPESVHETLSIIERIIENTKLWYHVQFKIDKWDVSNRELVNLRTVAEIIKSNPEKLYFICGYADVQTATPKHNLMLSENRVKQVFKVLTETFGVNPDQLVMDFKGGVDLMFYDDNELSRCVIIADSEGK